MTRPWWDSPRVAASIVDGVPVLMPGGRAAAIAALQARIAGYVPEWRDLGEEDAGVALVRLFGLLLDPILARVERLPEKAMVEFLRAAGLRLSSARAATAIAVFTPDERNTAPVEIPPGTRLLSARADGEKGDITWETAIGLSVPNLTLVERHAFDGEVALKVSEGETFAAFGDRPEVGAALYLGFEGVGRVAGQLSLAFEPADNGAPLPVAEGGAALPVRPAPQLRWEALTDRGFQPVDVEADTTDVLGRTGIVTLSLPGTVVAGRPAAVGTGDPIFWLRLRLAGGRLDPAPRLRSVHAHAVAITAGETLRNEFPVQQAAGQSSRVKLARAPVLSGSVVLEVDEGASGADLFVLDEGDDAGTGSSGTFRQWEEVATLAGQRPDARVFMLDTATGEILFGDGREGRAPPPGIRVVAVRAYSVTLGAAGNLGVDAISRLPVRIAGVSGVTNPFRAEGGAAAEEPAAAIGTGPAMIKTRGRAVSTGDMALLARQAPGANVLKAYALSGIDPGFPGANRPGTVGVFIVPRRHPSEPSDAPPVTTSATLGAVARHLARSVGPLGARIVAAAPRYERVRIEVTLAVAAGADPVAAERAARAALDRWLNPEAAEWRIGAVLRHADLTHVVLEADDGIAAVPFLAVTLDGIGYPACADVALRRFSLPWPDRHRLVVETEEARA
jgi:predicted phage baseplate assembly protein